MDKAISITKNIYWVGVNDYETDLFEAIWPLPQGVAYNSYLIVDDKVTLVDSVKKSFIPPFLEKIKSLLPEGKGIDYLIVNHMEPDHSGAITTLKEIFPKMKLVGNAKTAEYIEQFYGITEDVVVIKEADILDIGEHKLQFHITPMVHWPETMMTLELTQKILFSADAFGGFSTLQGGIFDDEVNLDFYDNEIRRYYSNIVAKFSPMVQRAIAKFKDIEINVIAPTHGPIFRSDPGHIISLYDKWSKQETEKGVVIVYASMYGNTQKMAEAVGRSLVEEGVENVKVFNVSRTHISYIINEIWRYKGLVLGSCTYNTRLFPLMNSLIHKLDNMMIKNHVLGLFGSYTWSGGSLDSLKKFAEKGAWQLVDPQVEAKSSPKDDDIDQCALMGKNIAAVL